MKIHILSLAHLVLALLARSPLIAQEQPQHWPQFRGPTASGINDGQHPPTAWDIEKGENVRWKTPIPGLGHSCPVVWGDRLFVTTAISGDPKAGLIPGHYGKIESVDDSSEHTWKIFCLDTQTGKVLWERTAHKGVPSVKRHLKGTHANPTPATDGKHVVAGFGSEGIYCCYDFDGNLAWKIELGTLDSGYFRVPTAQWGFGSSPIIYRDVMIVQCDLIKDSFLAAYDLADGKEVWRVARDEQPSWSTPTIVRAGDRDELVTNACGYIRGYDPLTGKELWKLKHGSDIAVPTPIADDGLIFVMSGKGKHHPIFAVHTGASGDISLKGEETSNEAVAWSQSKHGPYMPTPILYDDYLYTCDTRVNLITCYEARTGKRIYRERLTGAGTCTASPVAADGVIYFTSEEKGVYVVKAGPEFELLGVNPLDDVCMATPAIANGMLFFRTQHSVIGIGK